MVEYVFDLGLLEDIVTKYIVPKVMHPIMVVTPIPFLYINHDVCIRDFVILMCIYLGVITPPYVS